MNIKLEMGLIQFFGAPSSLSYSEVAQNISFVCILTPNLSINCRNIVLPLNMLLFLKAITKAMIMHNRKLKWINEQIVF